jgi:hypothetical protein
MDSVAVNPNIGDLIIKEEPQPRKGDLSNCSRQKGAVEMAARLEQIVHNNLESSRVGDKEGTHN